MTGGISIKRYSLSPRRAYLSLTLLSDLHIGSSMHDADRLNVDLSRAKRQGDRILLNGDVLDAICSSDPRYLPSCTQYPDTDEPINAAMAATVRLLTPVAARVDLIGIGNHEQKIIRNAGFNPIRQIARDIGREHALGGYTSIVQYAITWRCGGSRTFTIFAHHGAKGGRNSLLNAYQWIDADVIWVGHHHERVATGRMSLSVQGGKLVTREQRRVMTGAYLNAYTEATRDGNVDNYATIAGYAPGLPGGCRIVVGPDYLRIEQ